MSARWLPLVFLLLGACAPVSDANLPSRKVVAETTLPPMKTFSAPPARTPLGLSNTDLARDFLDLSFALESGRALPVFTRFETPVRLRVIGAEPATLRGDLTQLLDRLRREAGITVTVTEASDAEITIESVSRDQIKRVLPEAACFVAPNVRSLAEYRQYRRAPRTNWTRLETRGPLAIFVPNDVSPQETRDCLHEELAQALGPLNDLYRLPNSVFNDDNVHTVLTNFDMLMLRITYAPELQSGMTREEVAAKLPSVLARLNPDGIGRAPLLAEASPRDWVTAIETALGPGSRPAARRAAAEDAVRIATDRGWTDHRRGFSHYARARLLQGQDRKTAEEEYRRADEFFSTSHQTRLHRAYVATQRAAFALAANQPEEALALTRPHLDRARAAQNAALLATLQLLQAEALDALGDQNGATALRLDSLGWARYGFGSDWAVRRRLQDIAALNRPRPPA